MSAETTDIAWLLKRLRAGVHFDDYPSECMFRAAAEIERLRTGAQKLVEEWRQPDSCADDPWNSAKEWCADDLEDLVDG